MLAGSIPDSMVLYGGTAITTHLHHRVSQDLDFFFDDPGVDLRVLVEVLSGLRTTAVTFADHATLNAVFGRTKVRFLSATGQSPVDASLLVAGPRVASLRDLAATKVKVIGDRGELRDYYDLMVIEQRSQITAEQALIDYRARYADTSHLTHLVRALGYLGDVGDDPGLPKSRAAIEGY